MASSALTQIRRRRDQLATLRRMLDEARELDKLLREHIGNDDPTADQADELQRLAVLIDRREKAISEAGG